MVRKSIDLSEPTPPGWVGIILDRFDEFLIDHANCERKASALAMSLVVKHPDRSAIIPTLIALAQEELEHFRQVYELMCARGLRLERDLADPYVNRLIEHMRHGREHRFLDRLLVSSIIECRGAERFRIIADALADPQLQRFYHTFWKAEAKHGHQFVDMALRYHDEAQVYERLGVLMQIEGEIIRTLPWRASLH